MEFIGGQTLTTRTAGRANGRYDELRSCVLDGQARLDSLRL